MLLTTEQAVATAVTAAAPQVTVISPDGKRVISAWQTELYDLLFNHADNLNNVETTQAQKLQAFLKAHYGKKCPTFTQFQADRAALKTLAAFKGLVDDQWVRKPYNLAVKALYGALPVAMTEAAIAKRAARALQPKAVKAPAPVGAPKGETAPRNASAAEQVEQMVAKFGVFETMKAITAILKADAKTHTDALALEAIAAHYKAA
jgi:hypothetical protein